MYTLTVWLRSTSTSERSSNASTHELDTYVQAVTEEAILQFFDVFLVRTKRSFVMSEPVTVRLHLSL
jgi:hypothetical protein